MVSSESVDGVRFVKWNGITRFIWMPRRGRESGWNYQRGILVIGLLGWCVVLAPCKVP